MSDAAADRPRFSLADAATLVREHWGLDGAPAALPSYADQNVRLDTPDGRFVLKLASAAEEEGTLAAQTAAMRHLSTCGLPVPVVVSARDGRDLLWAERDGRRHAARLVTWLDGVPYGHTSPHTPGLRRRVGALAGQVATALADFEHPGAHRELEWDVRHAPATLARSRTAVADAARQRLVDRVLARFAAVEAGLATLPQSVVHGDANDFNVLVGVEPLAERPVAGLIDFGDLVHTVAIAELAVAVAYAVMYADDVLAAAADLAGGFHAERPLTPAEVAVLAPLVGARLAVSGCMAAASAAAEPGNAYLTASESPAWGALARWDALPDGLAEMAVRHACGWAPSPTAPAVTDWLRAHADALAPTVSPDPATAPVHVFDFSVGSTEWPDLGRGEPMLFADALVDRLAEVGAAVGVGRYDEARIVYAADQFASEGERRTIHVGLDLYLPAGTPVAAPLAGTVVGLADNDAPLDYGPTVILEHHPDGCPPFWTLYGHLDRATLGRLAPGARVEAGEPFAALGAPDENGGWAPHLHLQILTDRLGTAGDFPGVARASQRALWTSVSPDANLLTRIPAAAFPPDAPTADALLAARRAHVAPSLSVSYRRPLAIVRGRGQLVYDVDGRAYLDAVNNVAHVGHEHLRVVDAAQRQTAVLNTNTRYLHPLLATYAERLAATLPDPLSVCFLVNSGSEANDLALRLARAHTGRRDVAVLDHAYHGHTSALVDISPYKFDGHGGRGRPSGTHVAPLPDPYRGRYRGSDTAERYAAHVGEIAGRESLAAFVAESIPGVAGQVVLPDGFLRAAYGHTREHGVVCIADEVQVGFGRVGSAFWAFETQGVVPDIVTMGKPIGNGHPLAAVVTTPAIAASFANGMEYFNTFGGNPVSCAVGLAVLDVIEDEGLQAHALAVGDRLLAGLRELAHHPAVGDVRGLGLFVGVELVADREARTPAPEITAYVAERMRDAGILVSTDGPDRNVIKLKPPMVFSSADADRLVATLDRVLAEDPAQA
ncbi:aminotransferase class III-fold pyridoxal phosphate-dependent enzyme [Rubrivirga sp. IMCC45206]|uniref:aminotransferase class III-fold pyridoxal phosphate-dependent enzyme n=1 Tax=Rubrivirga sp. IMCC45206 TaxID=3391614 RepID=UPI00398FE3F5